ncbi:hypothetical protein Nepgr_003348 [Nepenthes gracilis]|uniref:Uncharacterized protein n=1 Tax=Nepenthes gracilis TaxID=150966 RepID=A0AAD3RZB3_NEPGR|nr:hypothetical protein Nepgr_003348 [Nepenthes gracilis]
MPSSASMPSVISALSVYTAIATSPMLLRAVINDIQTTMTEKMPNSIQTKIVSGLCRAFGNFSCETTLNINEFYNSLSTFKSARLPTST